MGQNLYVASAIAKMKLGQVARASPPCSMVLLREWLRKPPARSTCLTEVVGGV